MDGGWGVAIMAKLTGAQLRYLRHHRIEVEETFDASGLKRADYGQRMKVEGKLVAYGVTRCKYGHSLRTRRGQCIECFPASIAFSRRSELSGYIYICESFDGKLFKIGFSRDEPQNRIYIANLEGYGGLLDWRITFFAWSERAGAIEIAAHQKLAPFRSKRTWIRNGQLTKSTELYDCQFLIALRSVMDQLTVDELDASS